MKRGPLASTKHRCVSDEKNGDDRTNGSGLNSNVTRVGAFPTADAFNGADGQEPVKFSILREKCTLKHGKIHDPHERPRYGQAATPELRQEMHEPLAPPLELNASATSRRPGPHDSAPSRSLSGQSSKGWRARIS